MEIENNTGTSEPEILIETTDQIELESDSDSIMGTDSPQEADQEQPQEQPQEETQPETTQQDPDIVTKIEKQTAAIDALKTDLKGKGVDFNSAVKEYEEYGTLSQQTMADLAKAGYPKEVVESFLESRQVLEAQFTEAVFSAAGGAKEYENITRWAAQNLPEKVVKSFNRAVDSNNLEAISLMIDGIKAKMIAKQGTRNPSLIGGATVGSTKGFTSKAEVVKAMSDPRYGKDAQYMREIETKMLHTQL